MRLHLAATLIGAAVLVLAVPGIAAADPPGPTDYQSDISEIDPPVDGISAVMIGGDSFLQLTVDPGIEVLVIGYQGEPYVRFLPDGRVQENLRSPSRYLNFDRFGDASVPPEADADAPPEWIEVADDGSWAWHDHRTHWMNDARPIGSGPGDQILEAVVPIEVDGQPVSMTVVSYWQPAPSRIWPLAGGLAVLAATAALWRWRGSLFAAVATLGIVGFAALAIGLAQVLSLPSETEPSELLWVLPITVLVPAVVAAALARSAATRPLAAALVVLAGAELAVWGWLRRDGLGRAILPTDAPFDVDRAVTAAALVAGIIGVLVALRLAFRNTHGHVGGKGAEATDTSTGPDTATLS